ncbi:MAG: hypothetical protein ACO39C_06930 [Chthoniobacterales bacterium]|jgi:hypothetical protein
MKIPHPNFVIAAVCSLLVLAPAQAETQILHYPTEDQSIFTIQAPGDWEVTGIDAVGEFGSLQSENGSVLQFRAIECGSEDDAIAEIDAIAESTIAHLTGSFTDIKLGDVEELEIEGMPAFQLIGDGKDEEGNDVRFLSAMIILGPTTVAEVWAAAYAEDLDSAQAVLGSFKPTSAAAAE